MEQIGILGGTFNPIHYGHLAAAEEVRCRLGLDHILFIPSGQPPHKSNVTYKEHRYLMTLLATADNPNFKISRIEIDRDGPSYTVDTLRILKEQTKAELFFIVGADEMNNISTWRDAEVLPSLCNWVPVSRPGYSTGNAMEIPGVDISSTEMRNRISKGQNIKYLLPEAVERYIIEVGLDNDYEKIHKAVAARLSEKRYRHTMGVLETSLLLAAKHGVNMKKAYLAALLHDYAKELPDEEKFKLCKEFGINLDTIQHKRISLAHGHLSAELAKREFDIQDPEVLQAISYHTTGKAGMGPLCRLLKIADNIEPNRPDYPGLEEIRTLANMDLTRGAIASISRDLQYNKDRSITIHHWGPEALEYLRREL